MAGEAIIPSRSTADRATKVIQSVARSVSPASSVWQLPFCIDTLTLSTQGGKPIIMSTNHWSLRILHHFIYLFLSKDREMIQILRTSYTNAPRGPHEAADAGQGTRMPRSQQWAGAADGAAEVFLGAAECKNAARPSLVRPSVGCCRR